MSFLTFLVNQIPDLKSQKYIRVYGQSVRQKVFSNQIDFLLLISDLSKFSNLCITLRYDYCPDEPYDQRLKIYLCINLKHAHNNVNSTSQDIESFVAQSFLSEFYQLSPLDNFTSCNLGWVNYIGESLKYEEVIINRSKDSLESLNRKGLSSYYVPLPLEANESNDMVMVCQAITSFKSPLILEITIEPDTTPVADKANWLNALDQMLSQLRQASSSSSFSTFKEGDRNAQLVSRIYEQYQSSYLTEQLYRYRIKALGVDEFAVRSVLGTLMLSSTKKSRYRTIVISRDNPLYSEQFQSSLRATQQCTLGAELQWEQWNQGMEQAEFGGDSITGKGSVNFGDLKPLHRLGTLKEIGGLFRIVVPSDAPISGIRQENDLTSLPPEIGFIDFGGYELTRPESSIQIALEQLNKHAFICGVPGSGKTTTAFNLLTQLWFHNIPFLVFEPAKTEYRSLLTIQPDLQQFSLEQLNQLRDLTTELRVYTLGNDFISPFRFNPFEVSQGVQFFEHIANLESSFRGALPLFGPLPALLSEALEEIYYDRGWTGEEEGSPPNLEIPTMRDLYNKVTALFDAKDYVGEARSNLKAALEVRIGSLLRRGVGAMLNTQRSSPSIEDLLVHPTILELDFLNQEQANLITFFLLTKIREYVKRQRTEGAGVPEHVILLEEAHNLVGRNLGAVSSEDANTKQEAANYVTRMLAEMRALREGIIIADQLPSAVASEVVKNTNIKIAHRLVAADDRKDIGQAMLLEQSQFDEIARLNPGEALLYMEGWYRPRAVKVPYENSAKVKLGIETSLTNQSIISLIQSYSWYRQSQQSRLETTISECKCLQKEYDDILEKVDRKLNKVRQDCAELQETLAAIAQEVFYLLLSEPHFELTGFTSASSEELVSIKAKIVNEGNLNNLLPKSGFKLRNSLKLKAEVGNRFSKFDERLQLIDTTNQNILKPRYGQQCSSLNRQLRFLYQQASSIVTELDGSFSVEQLKNEIDEIALRQRTIFQRKGLQIDRELQRLRNSRMQLEENILEVLNKAVERAKVEKIAEDFRLGGK